MPQISKAARDAVRARLADGTAGFNAQLAAIAGAYGITPFLVDVNRNLFESFVHPDAIEAASPVKGPVFCLYSMSSVNQNLNKFGLFSGVVTIGLDVHLSYSAGNTLKNADALADAVEDAMVRVFNAADWAGAYTEPLAYNGEIALQRRPLEMAGQHWRQTLSFRLTFQVDN